MRQPDEYRGSLGRVYEPPSGRAYLSVPVLPFLVGKPWDQNALNIVHALRPSYVRVTGGEIKCDARKWRVTVYLDRATRLLSSIWQEVEIGSQGESGYDVRNGYLKGAW